VAGLSDQDLGYFYADWRKQGPNHLLGWFGCLEGGSGLGQLFEVFPRRLVRAILMQFSLEGTCRGD